MPFYLRTSGYEARNDAAMISRDASCGNFTSLSPAPGFLYGGAQMRRFVISLTSDVDPKSSPQR